MLSLDDTVRLALKSSRAVAGARLERQERKLSLEGAEEIYKPAAAVEASVEDSRSDDWIGAVSIGPSLRLATGGTVQLRISRPLGGGGERPMETTLLFSQPLLKGFGSDIETGPLRKARMQDRIAIRDFRERIADTIAGIVVAYRGALRAKRSVEIARDALERARRQHETNRLLVQAGRLASRELIQSEATVADREFTLSDSQAAHKAANATLVNLLDIEETTRLELLDEPSWESVQPDLNESLKTAYAARADFFRAELAVETARIDHGTAEDNRRWDLSLEIDATRPGGGMRTDYGTRLKFSVPLWEGESRRALTVARNALERAKMDLAETRQRIGIEVRQAVLNVNVGLRRIRLASEGLELAREKLEIERLKFREGLSSPYQLARFEDDLVAAQHRELDAVVSYRDALTALRKTLGTTLERWGISVER